MTDINRLLTDEELNEIEESASLYEEQRLIIAKAQRDLTLKEIKESGCCCEYLGQCGGDPQKPDYCPRPSSELQDKRR